MAMEVTHRPGDRLLVAVLVGRLYPGPGGMSMRWWALREALGRHADCTFREIGCNRWEQCRAACQLTGQPPRDASALRLDGEVRLTERRYCEDYAARLAEELVADGVSVVVCSGLETNRYVPVLAERPELTVVLDMHNVEAELTRSIHRAAPPGSYHAIVCDEENVRRVEAAERTAVRAADAVWVCSPEDGALVAALHDDTAPQRTTVVPNVVGVPDRAPPPAGGERICYTGRMDYYPNMDAGLRLGYEIAPLVHGRGHPVPVVIAGAYAQEMMDGPALPPKVELVSDPADIVDLVTGGIMAVPLTLGGGTRFKVLEAFRYGAPVVSTAKGIEGLDVVPGEHYLPAETPAEFADALETLLDNASLRTRLAGAAWELVRDHYSVAALSRRLRGAIGAV